MQRRASDGRTADDGERDAFDERRYSEDDVEKTFLPVVQPHQYPPARAAAAAVVPDRAAFLQHVHIVSTQSKNNYTYYRPEGTRHSAYIPCYAPR